MAHFAAHRNRGRIFEVEPAEDAHRIEGLEGHILGWVSIGFTGVIARSRARQGIGKIEGNHLGSVIRRSQADDFGMALGGLGQKIGVGMDQIRDPHAFAVSALAGMNDVAVEINGLLAVGQDGRDADLVAVLDLEIFKRAGYRLLIVVFR